MITKTKTAMKTTHDNQLTTLNAKEYTSPVITVVEFKVEHCFQSQQASSQQTLLGDFFSSRDMKSSDCYYTGGEAYTEFTSNGEYATGSW